MTEVQARLGSVARAAVVRGWPVALAVYLVGRCTSAVLVLALGADQRSSYAPSDLQIPLARDPATYLNLVSNWDGQWYLQIAAHGYPGTLPTSGGQVVENVWAFYPLFPGVVGLLGRTGLPLPLAAALVSTLCGAVAMILLHAMLRRAAGEFTAVLTVAAVSFGPTSLVLQSAYTESMALLEVLAVFLALRHRRYLLAAVLVVALAFTRPVALPVAAVIGVTWLLRVVQRRDNPFPRRELLAHGALALGAAASFAVWPFICGWVTGVPDGYAQTQRAWLEDREGWSTWLSPVVTGDQLSLLLLALPVLAILVGVAARPAARAWGSDLRAWAILYPLFILAVSRPTTSIFRYLALTTVSAWPLPDVSERVRTPGRRVALLAAVVCVGIITQYVWIRTFWVITSPSITVIP